MPDAFAHDAGDVFLEAFFDALFEDEDANVEDEDKDRDEDKDKGQRQGRNEDHVSSRPVYSGNSRSDYPGSDHPECRDNNLNNTLGGGYLGAGSPLGGGGYLPPPYFGSYQGSDLGPSYRYRRHGNPGGYSGSMRPQSHFISYGGNPGGYYHNHRSSNFGPSYRYRRHSL